MELRRFRYFVTCADELHVGRAAERLGIAQPALSQQIKVLETALGVRLFHRVRRGIELTEVGRAFLPLARTAIAQADKAIEVARGAARGERGEIDIGYVGSAMLEPYVPSLIATFRAQFPSVEVRLTKIAAPDQIKALEENRLDIGFVRGVQDDPRTSVRTELFSKTDLVVAVPVDKFDKLTTPLRLQVLSKEPFIVLQDTPVEGFFARTTLKLCQAAGFDAVIALRVGEISSLVGLVAAGQGVGLVPNLVSSFAMPNVRFCKLPKSVPPIDLQLLSRRDTRSAVAKNFLKMARASNRKEG